MLDLAGMLVGEPVGEIHGDKAGALVGAAAGAATTPIGLDSRTDTGKVAMICFGAATESTLACVESVAEVVPTTSTLDTI